MMTALFRALGAVALMTACGAPQVPTAKQRTDVDRVARLDTDHLQPSLGCDLAFAGKTRTNAKLRSANVGQHYGVINGGNPVTVESWLQIMCAFDKATSIPDDGHFPDVISGVEEKMATLHGYVAVVKVEDDNDLHVEIAENAQEPSRHVVVEIPPGAEYCGARRAIWDLVTNHGGHVGSEHDFKSARPHVAVTGYVFLDGVPHGAEARKNGVPYCESNGRRGKRYDGESHVVGIWEIHPVLRVELIP